MEWTFAGEVWEWRGPSPFYFISIPQDISAEIKTLAAHASYGWGAIPVNLRIADQDWSTSIFPKDGHYIVPMKNAIRTAQQLEVGSRVKLRLQLRVGRPT